MLESAPGPGRAIRTLWQGLSWRRRASPLWPPTSAKEVLRHGRRVGYPVTGVGASWGERSPERGNSSGEGALHLDDHGHNFREGGVNRGSDMWVG